MASPSSRSGGASQRRSTTAEARSEGARPGLLYRAVKWFLILAIVGVVCMAAVFFLAYRATTIPTANAAFEAQTTNVYYAGGKDRIAQIAEQNRVSIPLSEIPVHTQDAFVAAEDRTFWSNRGIDPKGILRAAFSNAQGNATQGASTITQQYVKILYLTQERTLSRKVKEAFLSLKVQQQRSKSEILQGYMNTIYFGRDAYGVQAASRAYFGVDAKKLKVGQSALLAAVINSPSYLSTKGGKEDLKGRYQYVLNTMVDMDKLDAAKAEKLKKRLPKRIKTKKGNALGGQTGFVVDMVKDELGELNFSETDIRTGGLRIETTLTKQGMEAAENGVAAVRPDLDGLHVASASIDNRSGRLLSFYAGQDYVKSQLNWAKLGSSPGSTFKAFALAAAIKEGFSLKDTFDGNSPYVFPDGQEVSNAGEGLGQNFGSRISMIKAAQSSVNTAFMDMTVGMDEGPQKILDTAIAMGIPKNAPGLEPNLGISLGSATVSPIDMANGYATIANDGIQHDWFVVEKVTRAIDGEVLYEAKPKSERVIDEDIDRDVSYALQQVVQGGTGAYAANIGRPVAGKTGTATNAFDQVSSSWFVGYTPQVSTAVMYARGKGNEQLDGWLVPFYGSYYPTRTFVAIMTDLMEGMEVESFPAAAWTDGEAPSTGHAPYVPPPEPKPKPKPKPRKPDKTKKPDKPEPPPVTTQPPPPPTSTPPPPPTSTPPPPPTTTPPGPSASPIGGGVNPGG